MDFVYVAAALLLWLVLQGLAWGCARLQSRGTPR